MSLLDFRIASGVLIATGADEFVWINGTVESLGGFSQWNAGISPTHTLRHLLLFRPRDEAGDEEETDAKHTPASSSSEIFCLFWTLTISSTSSISSRIEVFEFTASTLTNKSSSSANRPLITGDDVLISLSILRRVKMKTLGNVYLKQVWGAISIYTFRFMVVINP